MTTVRVNKLYEIFYEILVHNDFDSENAKISAEIFKENTVVGVSSHGVNRFPSFIELVKSGHIKPNNKPSKLNSFNGFEQWDGNLGPGPNNAVFITDEVIRLSKEYGIGAIALKNTNHWMRPGYYAWEAANKGHILICWTNTIPIMPPWGARESAIGNNPIVLGVPRKEGNIVLDMALSQYSYGKLATFAREDKELPYAGGYDKNDNLTKNAKDIYDTHRPLPIGYWKGSGLALLLDLIATILSGGKSTSDLGKSVVDSGMSQMFISIDPTKFSSVEMINDSINEILKFYLEAENIENELVSYPGERIIKTRRNNFQHGVLVDDTIWERVERLKRGM